MKNSIVIAWDADNAGRKIGQSILADDLESLAQNSKNIKEGNITIVSWCQSKGGTIVSDGGDQGVSVFQNVEDEDSFLNEAEEIRSKYAEMTGMTLTMGAGLTLSQAGKALLVGKLHGKDQIFIFDQDTDDMLAQSHDHVAQGTGSEEENKLDEQYISEMDQQPEAEAQEYLEDDTQEFDPESEEYLDEELEEGDVDPDQYMEETDEMEASPEGEESDEMSEEGITDEDEFQDPEDTINEMIGAPEDQDSEFDQSSEIEIPESDEMVDQDAPQEMQEKDETEMANDLAADSQVQDESEQLKQQCAQVLSAFKAESNNLQDLKEMAPQLYEATVGMLQCMIAMSNQLFSQPQEAPEMEQEMPEDEMMDAPEMEEEIPQDPKM